MQRILMLLLLVLTAWLVLGGRWIPTAVADDLLPPLYVSPVRRAGLIVRQLVLVDKQRNKELPLRVSFPAIEPVEGRERELPIVPLPIIVWSHGMYGSKESYQPLVEWWASHGYVVLQPTHSDSISLMSPKERTELLTNFNLNRTEDWPNRPRDVRFILDSLAHIESQSEGLSGRLDHKRIGVGGHSFGAVTTQLVAGTRPRLSELPNDYSDDRPLAFVAISPNGEGPIFSRSGLQQVKRPLLVISGDHDQGRLGEPPNWRRTPFDESPRGDKYLLWIDDAHHNFGGISGVPPGIARLMREQRLPNADQVELVKTATLAFWDSYLNGFGEARRYLGTGRAVTSKSKASARLEVK